MELEDLAAVERINHYVHFLYGRPLKVVTDHQALNSLLNSKTLSNRLHRFVMELTMASLNGLQTRPYNRNQDARSRQEWADDDRNPSEETMSSLAERDKEVNHPHKRRNIQQEGEESGMTGQAHSLQLGYQNKEPKSNQ